jgi:hypothetical protein
MRRFRFVTPHRTGKWYPDLSTAQRYACEIGAGFLDSRTGRFIAYVGTKLEEALLGDGSFSAENGPDNVKAA